MVGADFVLTDFVLTDAAGTPPRIVSASPSGTPASSLDGLTADLAGDALFVAFASADPTLLPDDTNAAADIFTRATKHATAPS